MQQGGNNRGCMTIAMIVGIIIFFLLSRGGGSLGGGQTGANDGGDSSPPAEEENPQANSAPQQGGLIENIEGGAINASANTAAEDVLFEQTVNDVHWTILEADYLGDSLAGGALSENGEFVGVVYQIENLSDSPITLIDLQLVDGDNNTYSFSLDTSQSLEDGCNNVTLQPDSPVLCTAIFDVPSDASDLHALLTDFNMLGGAEELLDLELD